MSRVSLGWHGFVVNEAVLFVGMQELCASFYLYLYDPFVPYPLNHDTSTDRSRRARVVFSETVSPLSR